MPSQRQRSGKAMKTHQKVAMALIFGSSFPMVFLSTRLNLEGENNRWMTPSLNDTSENEVREGFHRGFDVSSGDDNYLNARVSTDRNERDDRSNLRSRSPIRGRRQRDHRQTNTTNAGRKNNLIRRQRQRRNQTSTVNDQVLEFVHITKTGGTAVEKAAAEVGINWGPKHRHFYDIGLRQNLPIPNFKGEKWHTPPSWFEKSPYHGKKTFTIVRNPYDRVVSEFYCEFFGYYIDDVQSWSKSRLIRYYESLPGAAQLSNEQKHVIRRGSSKSILRYINQELGNATKKPLPPPTLGLFNNWISQIVRTVRNDTAHMIPQHYYVYENANGTIHQCVDHVLRYENLDTELSVLMQQYRLPRLNISRSSGPGHRLDQAGNPKFSSADLDARSICLINRRYTQDFELIGYEMKQENCSHVLEADDVESNTTFAPNNYTVPN